LYKNNFIKVYLLLDFKKNYGGGFKFLSFLKFSLLKKKLLEKNILKAKFILLNSHHNFVKIIFFKFFYPKKIFIHRVDGPISSYMDKHDMRDDLVNIINKHVADATIYQSNWSKKKHLNLNYNSNKLSKVIYNCADSRFFFNKNNKKKKNSIIICSFSNNINKGFKYYSYLDNNLNFNKYSVTFVGNTFVKFKNIKTIPVQTSRKLGSIFNKHSIYLTASKNDPCSNSLLEALACKLPSIVLNSGGHPEILKKRGYVFNSEIEMLNKIHSLKSKYKEIKNINFDKEYNSCFHYMNFIKYINDLSCAGKVTPKKINFFKLLYILATFYFYKII
jgi:glycosyltransferase involved in cell wall biosynthesis